MAKLLFEQIGRLYTATIVSNGQPIPIQIEREEVGNLFFKASLGEMKPISIRGIYSAGKNFITTINVPEGVKITIESETEVLDCEYGG